MKRHQFLVLVMGRAKGKSVEMFWDNDTVSEGKGTYCTSGIASDQGRKIPYMHRSVHIRNHRLPTPRLHLDPPRRPRCTTLTSLILHRPRCKTWVHHLPYNMVKRPSIHSCFRPFRASVFLSMLSVTSIGLKWSISGVEGQSLDSGAMVTLLEADPAHHIALQGHLMVLERYICSIESFFLQQEWRTAQRLQI